MMNLSIQKLVLVLAAISGAIQSYAQLTVPINFTTQTNPDRFFRSVILSGIDGYNYLNLDMVATAGSGFEIRGDDKDFVNLTLAFYGSSGLEISNFELAQFGGSLLDSNTYQSVLIGGTEIHQTSTPVQWSVVVPNNAISASLTFYGSLTDSVTEYVNLNGNLYASASAIPEPSTYAAILGGGALVFYAFRRKRIFKK